MSPLQSPLPKTSEDHPDSVAQEEKHTHITESEDETEGRTDDGEDGSDCRRGEGSDDEEDDEDYEEFVVNPRHLNEVTSLTDKTSPWTSILSEPDLVVLETLEAPDEPDLSQDQEKDRQVVSLESLEPGRTHECTRQEENDSFNASAGDISDTEGEEDERTRKALDQRQTKGSHTGSGDACPSPTQHTTDTPDAPLEDPQLQPYP